MSAIAAAAEARPAVYLYNNPDFPTTERPPVSVLPPYGFDVGSGQSIAETLYARLHALPRAPPEAADVYFAFLTPYSPPYHAWTRADQALIDAMGPEQQDYLPNAVRLKLRTMCRQLRNSSFMRSLMPHISRATVRRHYLVTPNSPDTCHMEAEFQGPDAPKVPQWVRRTLLDLSFDNLIGRDQLVDAVPRAVAVPYMSSVRWSPAWERSHSPPWLREGGGPPQRGAPLLATFTGSLRGQPRSVQLRRALTERCRNVSKHVCTTLVTGVFPIMGAGFTASEESTNNLRRALRLKRRATFCLEPPGYSPPRKSIIDSILSGCIPVLFYSEGEYEGLWPLFFGSWGTSATVRIQPEMVLQQGMDVLSHLAAIEPDRVRAMQQSIARNAHRLAYGLGATGVRGDAIDTLMTALAGAQHRQEEVGGARSRQVAGVVNG